MSKIKLAWAFVLAALVGALAWFADLFRKQEEQRAREKAAADLKAKVEALKAQRAEEKAATEAKVEQVQAKADAAKEADSVDVANDLIAGAKKS